MDKEYYLDKARNQKLKDLFEFRKGDSLVLIGNYSTDIPQFAVLEALTDTVEGIFPNRPFIWIEHPNGGSFAMHASRLVKLES